MSIVTKFKNPESLKYVRDFIHNEIKTKLKNKNADVISNMILSYIKNDIEKYKTTEYIKRKLLTPSIKLKKIDYLFRVFSFVHSTVIKDIQNLSVNSETILPKIKRLNEECKWVFLCITEKDLLKTASLHIQIKKLKVIYPNAKFRARISYRPVHGIVRFLNRTTQVLKRNNINISYFPLEEEKVVTP